MFLVLGPLVFPNVSCDVAVAGLALALILVVVVRRVAVWMSTAFIDFTNRERLLLGWAGLRGAVPIVLATFALSEHFRGANTIFNDILLRRCGLGNPAGHDAPMGCPPTRPPFPGGPVLRNRRPRSARATELDLVDFVIASDDAIAGAAVRELGLRARG